jgi:hypothetical protein
MKIKNIIRNHLNSLSDSEKSEAINGNLDNQKFSLFAFDAFTPTSDLLAVISFSWFC